VNSLSSNSVATPFLSESARLTYSAFEQMLAGQSSYGCVGRDCPACGATARLRDIMGAQRSGREPENVKAAIDQMRVLAEAAIAYHRPNHHDSIPNFTKREVAALTTACAGVLFAIAAIVLGPASSSFMRIISGLLLCGASLSIVIPRDKLSSLTRVLTKH
jgi:hypothetical protein